jgi:hypothetical protein
VDVVQSASSGSSFFFSFFFYYSYVHTRLGSFLPPAPTPWVLLTAPNSLTAWGPHQGKVLSFTPFPGFKGIDMTGILRRCVLGWLLLRRCALLLQTANGNVEAKVVCFYRRRDISSTLIALADKHASESLPSLGVDLPGEGTSICLAPQGPLSGSSFLRPLSASLLYPLCSAAGLG